jgi:hypothetical protein
MRRDYEPCDVLVLLVIVMIAFCAVMFAFGCANGNMASVMGLRG